MSPSPPGAASIRLSCPLYGADFDPLNSDFLIVAGGGGEGKSGVGNKIFLLNTSRRNEISEIVDIELSREEDNPTSLAVALSTDTSITAYAGISSSQSSQKAGQNEHFRSFRIDHPPRRTTTNQASAEEKVLRGGGKTEAVGRTSFFTPSSAPKKETYQRITRVSPAGKDRQVAAIATGLAVESEIVVFRAVSNPQSADELARISLGRKEAEDLDIVTLENDDLDHLLAFCTDSEVYTQRITNHKAGCTEEATLIYGNSPGTSGKIKNRALRFVTPQYLLLLQNLPQRSGAELLVLKLDESGGMVVLQKRLSSYTKVALGLDVCILSSSPSGDRQIVVAVSGQTGSIEVLSLELSSVGLGKFRPYVTLKDVHQGSITKLVFSTFMPPTLPVTKDTLPQSIKLASVSVSQTVTVHTFPLQPYPPPNQGQSKRPRYILPASAGTSDAAQAAFSVFMASLVIALAAFLLQAFTEIRGGVPPYLGAADWLSPRVKQFIHRPYMFADGPILPSDIPVVATVTQGLKDLVDEHFAAETPKAIVVREDSTGELSTEVRHGEDLVEQETLRKWEDLQEHEQENWKKKLSDAGHWTASQGETVLKGILFSEWAGLVGDIVRG